MKDHKIILTGGHHTSALVVAQKLQQKGSSIYWFGHKYTMKGAKNISAEARDVASAGIPFYNLWAGKFHKGKILDFLKLPIGFLQTLFLLLKIKPHLIVSFGGYLSVPAVIAGWILKIPSVTHEQTTTAGRANRLLKHFVKKIFITFKKSAQFFPKEKTVLTGLPMPDSIIDSKKTQPIFTEKLPIIIITGGKQGSHTINKIIEKILPQLLKKYNLFHQTGETSFTKDLVRLKKKRSQLRSKYKKRYRVVGYITTNLFINALKQADIVITRAGAHTVYSLAILRKKAILIPLSFSFDNEQEKKVSPVKTSA